MDFVLRIALRFTTPWTNSSYRLRGCVDPTVPVGCFQGAHRRIDSVEPRRGKEYLPIMSDHEIQLLESQFPAVSGEAFAAARRSVLA